MHLSYGTLVIVVSCVPCRASLKDVHTTVDTSRIAANKQHLHTNNLVLCHTSFLLVRFALLVVTIACMTISFKYVAA